MSDEKVQKKQMVTVGNFKSGGTVYAPGTIVSVTAEDLMQNPGNFTKVPKVEPVVEAEPVKGKK